MDLGLQLVIEGCQLRVLVEEVRDLLVLIKDRLISFLHLLLLLDGKLLRSILQEGQIRLQELPLKILRLIDLESEG